MTEGAFDEVALAVDVTEPCADEGKRDASPTSSILTSVNSQEASIWRSSCTMGSTCIGDNPTD